MIPYGKQDISEQDVDEVISVLRSEFLTQGPKVPEFESRLAAYCGASHALAVNSATSALHIACLALGLGRGDILWTSPITFVASANCGLYCGAKVDFVDIDPRSFNMCPQALAEKLKRARAENCLPKVVIPVHLCGQSCDMQAIYALSKEYGFNIIEDASHAIGGKYRGEPVGCCSFSDITIFSFHPVKIITTGEGGMAVTNCSDLAQKMNLYRSHYVTRDESLMTEESHGPWYYQQVGLGFNYRMTELQAALGLSQLNRLDKFVAERHKLAKRYDDLLGELPIKTPLQVSGTYSGFHLYVVQVEDPKCHRQIFTTLRAVGIGVNLHYIPVHTQPYYRAMGFSELDFPNAMDYYRRSISIPIFHLMTQEHQNEVVSALASVLEG